MNRIYQGRISKVEITEINNDAWQELPDWESVLWKHHALFQDAINYYISALLGMATSRENPLTEVRKRLAETCTDGTLSVNQIWTEFRRSGDTRPGMRDSLARTVSVKESNPAPDDYFKAILSENSAEEKVLDLTVRELLAEIKSGDGAIQTKGRDMLPRFCDPRYTGEFPHSATQRTRKCGELWLHSKLHDLDPCQLEDAAKVTNLRWVANLSEGNPFVGIEAKDRLEKAVNHFMAAFDDQTENKCRQRVREFFQACPNTEAELTAISASIGQMSDEQTQDIPRNKKAHLDKTSALLLFKHFPRPFTWKLLTIVFPRRNQQRNEDGEGGLNAEIEKLGDDPIKLARGDRGYVFPAFTASRPFGVANEREHRGKPAWKEFDIAAFKEALKSLHQIEAIGKKRDGESKHLEKTLAYMNNEQGWKPRGEGDEDPPDVVAGDPRIKRLVEILESDLVQPYEMADGEEREYGLRRRTIRGFRRLRERWRRTVKPGDGYTEARREKLRDQLKEYQRENADFMGSSLLFEKLTEKENWIVWQEQSAKTIETWRKEANIRNGLDFADNPLEALVKKLHVEQKIERLKEPVRLTPADPQHSPRHYSFSDDTAFGKRGGYGHQEDCQSVVVAVAAIENGVFVKRKAKLHYSAPRLSRDGLYKSKGKQIADSPFLQPMMEGLGCTEPLEQKGNHAVSLMPAKGDPRRFLLNFALEINTDELIKKLGKKDRWTRQFVGIPNQNLYLCWPSVAEVNPKPKQSEDGWWWERDENGFTCLAVDLGQRTAGAYAIVEARANANANGKPSRFIGNTDTEDASKEWRAVVMAQGMLRLPGEDRRILVNGDWKQEDSGKKGRMNNANEWQEARDICDELGIAPVEVKLGDSACLSFPEVNDQLLQAFGRAKWRLQRLQRLSSRLRDSEFSDRAVREVADSEELKRLLALTGKENPEHMAEVVTSKLKALRSKLPRVLERIADRILPLRNDQWRWRSNPESSSSHILRRFSNVDIARKKIMGQRGLSFRRIEQLETLRRQVQGLNKALIHIPGQKPIHGHTTRGEEWPDPCPEILEKLNRARDQRINQTAHMILAEALGVRLRASQKSVDLRVRNDIHGEYERLRDPVDFIVLEDLSRYQRSQDRPRRENSRLMQWSHRAILKKLKELAELYGIPVVETNAAYSSRFCSRSGVVGFRAAELTPNHRYRGPWERKLSRLERGENHEIELGRDEKNELERVRELFDRLDEINDGRSKAGKPFRTLLAPLNGGPIFVPADESAPLMQADINAAINLALRAIASPDCLDIHPRIRTQVADRTIRLRLETKQEKSRWRRHSDTAREVHLDQDSSNVWSKRYPDFFVDRGKVATFDQARIDEVDDPVASSHGLFGSVKDRQWEIVKHLNHARLKKWGFDCDPAENLPC